jgi:hypothetical protein
MKTFLFVSFINFFSISFIGQLHGQEHLTIPEKFSVLHFRLGTNSLRELGFNANLFNCKIPELTIGFGYRSKNESDIVDVVDKCFSIYPMGRLINLKAQGPFFTIGYEMKNKVGRRQVVNPAFQIQVRRLKTKNLSYGNHDCDEMETTLTESFNAKVLDVNFRGILDICSNESWADFYIGMGVCRRFLKKEIFEINNVKVNKIGREPFVPIFSFFLGLRFSFMDTI